jgi:4-hydroxybutyryl-CoA dehydratase/vinylacetyl-CoA-Delta-isomerase
MMNREQYVESLRRLKMEVYFQGERVESVVDSPAMRPHVNAAAETYAMAHDPQYEELLTATSHLTGKRINRFTHIHQSTDDLIKQVKMLRAISQRTGTCYQRCVGHDGLNALYSVTYEMDQALGTAYHARFVEYLKYVQESDVMCDGAMTDPKGDRSLAPSKQADPDLYLRVVERRPDGIVVNGAKAHQTGAVNSHEIIVMPTTAMGPDDADYAVAFAVPADSPGLFYIFGRQTNDSRKYEGEIDCGNPVYGTVGGEALAVFDHVFVPNERIFMCGEHQFAGTLVDRFASYHRQRYGGCRGGWADVLIGATVAIAEQNGADKASHVRDKIVEMTHMAETIYCGSIACSVEGRPTPSGAWWVDPLLANTTKLNVTRHIYEICRLAHDVAGGLLATLPSEKDFDNPRTGPYIEKYFRGRADVPTEHRIRVARLIENMTSGTPLVESMHGAGSPQAQRINILRLANLQQKKKLALRLAGVPEGNGKQG